MTLRAVEGGENVPCEKCADTHPDMTLFCSCLCHNVSAPLTEASFLRGLSAMVGQPHLRIAKDEVDG